MSEDALLRLAEVATGYEKKQVLFGVSVDVHPAEMVTIIGPNGAGKSTVIKAVMGYLHPWQGHITLDGQRLEGLKTHERIKLGIGYVPQGRTVFPGLTVQEHLEMGGWLLRSKREKREALNDIFARFPLLRDRRSQKAGTMSGGERQLLSLFRALMLRPKVLLLDEPSLGLAPRLVSEVFARLKEINDQGVALLVVEQNATVALRNADRGYVLEMGANRFEGVGEDLLQDPQVRTIYLGGDLYP